MNEVAWSSSPNDMWNLIHLQPTVLRYIYCDTEFWGRYALKPEGLKKRRQKYRKLTSAAVREMPGRTEEYRGPDEERERVRERRISQAPKVGEAAIRFSLTEADRIRLHNQLDELLDSYELDPATVDQLRIKKVSTWQMGFKDNDGEAQSHPLYGIQLEADPKQFKPQWPAIAPVALEKPLRRVEKAKNPSEMSVTVVAPDLQIPFVDNQALDVFYQVLADTKADNIVQLGDALDLTAYSRFIDREIYANTTQQATIDALKFFANCRRIAKSAKITFLEGNHEQRLPRDILGNHRHNFGLRPADKLDGDPLLSIPTMVGLPSVDVEYLPGYPNNRYWINDNLQIIHGSITGKSESKRVNFAEKVSTIYGHTHRLNHDIQTINRRDGADYRHSYGTGCLSRIDTHVPSLKSGYDLDGQPVGGHHENWQHGFLVVTHDERSFHIEQVFIDTFNGYKTLFRGKVYEPRA